MNYIFKDFEVEINDNVLYLKSKCYKTINGKDIFYSVVDNNKVYDVSKDLSNAKLDYNNVEMINKNNLKDFNNQDCIYLSVPDKIHILLIPVINVMSKFDNDIIDTIYNGVEKYIDMIDEYTYNENKDDYSLNPEDLDYLKSCLYQVQAIALSKFGK